MTAIFAVMFGVFVVFAPLADLRQDKTLGHLEFDRVLPLSEAAAAHRLQEDNTLRGAGTLTGKIVLKP